jgi:hypothetical protein
LLETSEKDAKLLYEADEWQLADSVKESTPVVVLKL